MGKLPTPILAKYIPKLLTTREFSLYSTKASQLVHMLSSLLSVWHTWYYSSHYGWLLEEEGESKAAKLSVCVFFSRDLNGVGSIQGILDWSVGHIHGRSVVYCEEREEEEGRKGEREEVRKRERGRRDSYSASNATGCLW